MPKKVGFRSIDGKRVFLARCLIVVLTKTWGSRVVQHLVGQMLENARQCVSTTVTADIATQRQRDKVGSALREVDR